MDLIPAAVLVKAVIQVLLFLEVIQIVIIVKAAAMDLTAL